MSAGADLPAAIILTVSTVFLGLCLGSFATALVYRIPRGMAWAIPSKDDKINRSRCPSCNVALRIFDLVPVFSWLFSRGRCRHCHAKISVSYPLIELTTMLLTVALFWAWGFSVVSAPLLLAVPFMVAAVIIDWERMILPDDINISLSVLAVFYVLLSWWNADWAMDVFAEAALGALLLSGTMFAASYAVSKWKGRPALGQGDLKFLPAAGLFLGIAPLPYYLGLSGLLGLFTALLKGEGGRKAAFPFGPALIISLYIHVFLTGLGFDYTW
ncbi:MAG TPA: prepilin peptidase [Micavibrio sp.]|nr:prepilin peptidase [Micavibrio sp.]